jgi:hypothetical protein
MSNELIQTLVPNAPRVRVDRKALKYYPANFHPAPTPAWTLDERVRDFLSAKELPRVRVDLLLTSGEILRTRLGPKELQKVLANRAFTAIRFSEGRWHPLEAPDSAEVDLSKRLVEN